jgi:hypothetical protein
LFHALRLFEFARVLVRFDHVASRIVDANYSIMWPARHVLSRQRGRSYYSQRKDFSMSSLTTSMVFAKPRQGVVANVLNFSRNGTVGFINWLDLFCKNRIIVPK